MKAGFTASSKLCPKTCYMNMKQIPGYKILICSFLLMSRYICLINKVLLQHLLWNTHWWHNSYISHVIDYNVLSKKRTQAFPESSSPVVSSTRPFYQPAFWCQSRKTTGHPQTPGIVHVGSLGYLWNWTIVNKVSFTCVFPALTKKFSWSHWPKVSLSESLSFFKICPIKNW